MLQRAAALTSSLESAITAIVGAVNERRSHIPPVVSANVVSFPFDITITSSGSKGISAGVGTVKRLLLAASPPPVLS